MKRNPRRLRASARPRAEASLYALAVTGALTLAATASAQDFAPGAVNAPVLLDRAVVRYTAPETGGNRSPRFIYERVLAFQARLEALADPDRAADDAVPYRER